MIENVFISSQQKDFLVLYHTPSELRIPYLLILQKIARLWHLFAFKAYGYSPPFRLNQSQ